MGDNNAIGRKSFILHIDSLCVLNELTNEQKGILFDAIYKYHLGEIIELDFAMKMAFLPFRNQFERDYEKYQDKVNVNKINGLKGGRPKKPKETQKTQSVLEKPKKPDNDNDSNNDNDNGSKNDSDLKKKINYKKWTLTDFQNDIAKNKETYTSEMLKDFYNYWSEPNSKGEMRFQMMKTWETSRRLITWKRNQKKFHPETIVTQFRKAL